ncbi:MAG: tryptophan synthase subunit alpha, partial [Treponema sp.]|nr:tryptophan synthase subunit alpha [Treponema sp.]
MSNIGKAFEKGTAFIGFVTGGDPDLETSAGFVLEMVRAGADLVEIGIPFSDPIAEGPVIQEANIRALAAGTTTEKLFAMVESIRKQTAVPLVFLTYLNPVFHYGYDRFFRRCRETGVDGIIIPDLPFEEQDEVRSAASPCGVDLISLIAPTSQERSAEIARSAAGFLYLVSSMGVTGIRGDINAGLAGMIARVRSAAKLPVAVGFGIHTPAQAEEIARIADGVIVGSAIVKIAAEYGREAGPYIYRYVKEM